MNTSTSETRHNLCKRQFSDGRRCRMLRMEGHPSLCPFHVREEKQLLEADKLGEELASLSGKLNTGTDINHVLAKVFKALADGRISARTAAAFAYLGQLLLQTMPYVKNEISRATRNGSAYHDMVRDSIPLPQHAQAPATRPLGASSAVTPRVPIRRIRSRPRRVCRRPSIISVANLVLYSQAKLFVSFVLSGTNFVGRVSFWP
jgi:hypothetical protein